jgi:hypothetical protein
VAVAEPEHFPLHSPLASLNFLSVLHETSKRQEFPTLA